MPSVENDGPVRRLTGFPARLSSFLAAGLSLYSLYWVLFIIQPQVYRVSFLLIALVLTFILFPGRKADTGRVRALDWVLAGAAVVALAWPIVDFQSFI
jgi:TRAP-type uncharacterized transport system fused permease subunit